MGIWSCDISKHVRFHVAATYICIKIIPAEEVSCRLALFQNLCERVWYYANTTRISRTWQMLWRYDLDKLTALLIISVDDLFFNADDSLSFVSLNKLLYQQSICRWFGIPQCSCGFTVMYRDYQIPLIAHQQQGSNNINQNHALPTSPLLYRD